MRSVPKTVCPWDLGRSHLDCCVFLLEIFGHYYVPSSGGGNGNPLQYSCLENSVTEEPGGPRSMGLLRVGHGWATSVSLFTFMHWRRKWQPTPVFLPGESQGWGSLVASVSGVAQSGTRLKWLSSSSSRFPPGKPGLSLCNFYPDSSNTFFFNFRIEFRLNIGFYVHIIEA